MKINRWLMAAVAILALGLTAESIYLFRIKNSNVSEKEASYPMAMQGTNRVAPASAFPTRSSNSVLEPWNAFQEMDQIQTMMNRMFRDSFNRGFSGGGLMQQNLSYEPDLDVQETADAYVIRLDLPGVEKDKIDVKVQNNVLIISGERRSEKEDSSQNGGLYRMESSFGSFLRSFPLPANADPNGLTAESKNGVLNIRLLKIKNALPATKNIQVQ